jgi:hypothetical protein
MEVIGQKIYSMYGNVHRFCIMERYRFRIDSAEIMYGINLDRFVSVLMVLLNLRLKKQCEGWLIGSNY